MSVTVLYLGPLADTAGRAHSAFSLRSGDFDWPGLLAVLEDQVNREIADAARDPRNKVAVNGVVIADRDGLVLRHGDELALLPPVSGG